MSIKQIPQAYPLTSSQRDIFLDQLLHSELPLYNIGGHVTLSGSIDLSVFDQAVNLLIQKHDNLRLQLINKKSDTGLPQQTIVSPFEVSVPLHDVSAEADPQAAAKTWMQQRFVQPFALYDTPLFRYDLIKLADDHYYWLMQYHHLIMDGWAIALLNRSLGELYTTLCRGEQPTWHTHSYLNYITQEQTYLTSTQYAQDKTYWIEQFTTVPDPLFKPQVTSAQTNTSDSATCYLPRKLYQQLEKFSQQHQASVFHVLLGALTVYLMRTQQQSAMVIGLPTLNRSGNALKQTAGLFTGISPTLLQPNLQGTFADYLRDIRQTLQASYRHQRFPVSEINRAVQSTSQHHQLYDVTLSYERHDYQADFATQSTHTELLLHGHAQTPLTLYVRDFYTTGDIKIDFVYNAAYFKLETIQALQTRWLHLLETLSNTTEIPLYQLPLMSEAEQHQLKAWCDTTVDYPPATTWVDLFEAQVANTPDNLAVQDANQQLSYQQLNAQANQLAHHLLNLADAEGQPLIKPDTIIGLCVERSSAMLIGVLGILKAGAAYLPLDPDYPAERLQYMLDDSQVPALLTQQHGQQTQVQYSGITAYLDQPETFSHQVTDNPARTIEPDHLAYVIYTSGSTGKPKGVMIPHRALHNYVQHMQQHFTAGKQFAWLSTVAADLGNTLLYGALCTGGTLQVISHNCALNAQDLQHVLQQQAIDYLKITPTHLQSLQTPNTPMIPGQLLIVGGEASPVDWISRLQQAYPHCNILNHYGPTEATIGATTYTVDAVPLATHTTLPIGKPIANTQVYILDPQQQLTPIGAPGELCIAGAGLARGYLNRPELTAEKFIQIALFGNTERVYKTGDLARWLPDGNLEYLGRIDNQIKLRGFRIELGEIEAQLSEHATVSEAVVVLHKRDENQTLAAYVTPIEPVDDLTTSGIVISDLRDWLKARLPEYMLPSFMTVLHKLPLTANGKIDRQALPDPDNAIDTEQTVLQTDTAQLLATLWTAVLKVDVTHPQAHFFELGGHSLLATQLIARIREAFSIELPLATLFEYPMLGELAHWLDQQQRGITLPPLDPQPTVAPKMLSYAQQRLWFLARLEGPSATYNMPTVLRLHGELDSRALRKTFCHLVERHTSLRLSFPARNGKASIQLLAPYDPVNLTNGQEIPAAEQQQYLANWIQTQATAPFDLATGPLFRLELLTLAADEHIILSNLHHIISDGWSNAVLRRDWVQLYTAYRQHQTPVLAPLSIDYLDYAAWQRGWLQGPALDTQRNYWQQRLAGAPHLLELPADYPRPAQQSYQGALYHSDLSPALSTALKQLSQAQGCTLFMTLLTAFNTLLHRYTGQDDILIGSPVANRTQRATEDLVGLFVNTLIFRSTQTADQPTRFSEQLQQTRQTALAAYGHQDIPFEQLVEALNPVRSLSHSPLCQVMLILQNTSGMALDLPDLTVTPLAYQHQIAKLDLTLSVVDTNDQLQFSWEYATDLFQAERIARMAEHFVVLLETVVAQPSVDLRTLSLLTPTETQQLQAWNATTQEYPKHLTFIEQFEIQVANTPDNIAVRFEQQHLSYQQLNTQANQVAHYLQGQTDTKGQPIVQHETLVGLYVERSMDMMIGLLGILKAGAAYLPLDPDYPAARLRYLLADSQVPLVLTQQHLHTTLSTLVDTEQQAILCLDQTDTLATQATHNLASHHQPDQLAYVLYTSGSTGKPKGVMITQQALHNFLTDMQARTQIHADDTLLALTTLAFDIAGLELYLPLMTGATVQLISRAVATDAKQLQTQLADPAITLMQATPATWQMLLDSGWQNERPLTLISGGEALNPDLGQQLLNHSTQLWNLYGPTETTIWSAAHNITEHPTQPSNIGQPIANTRIYILDAQRNPLPIGIPGELCIAGDGLARGYINRPDLTAEKFIHIDLFGNTERVYKTGDLACWRADGHLEYRGRIDNQIKLRGFRIELGEIETVLRQAAQVNEAVVTLHQRPQALAAYVTATDGNTIDLAELRETLKQQLPDYMVPGFITILETLPLTPNGKLDRQALPTPTQTTDTDAEKLQSHTEQRLADLWADLLDLEITSPQAHFFNLGGHSLLATQLVTRIQDSFAIEMPLRTLFEYPYLGELAAWLDRQPRNTTATTLLPQPAAAPKVLSYAQQRLWFLNQLEGPSATYNLATAQRLHGNLNITALRESFKLLVERQPSLRTCFPLVDGAASIQLLPAYDPLTITDLTADENLETAIKHNLNTQTSSLFELETGPLFRVQLLILAPDDYILAYSLHHIIADGWSLQILQREWMHSYTAYSEGQTPQLAPLPVHYTDYAAWQQTAHTTTTETELTYWKNQLAGAPQLIALPSDTPRPAQQSYQGAHYRHSLSEALTTPLKTLSQQHDCTLYMTLLAVFNLLLHRYTGQDDLLIGTPIAGRTEQQTEHIVGLFVNTLVLRSTLDSTQTVRFSELLQQTRQTALEAYAHQTIPFEQLVEALQPERSLSHSPLIQVMMALQSHVAPPSQLPQLTHTPYPQNLPIAKFDLSLNITELDGQLHLHWEYATDLFQAARIERMAAHLEQVLENVVSDPARDIHALSMHTAAERQQHQTWNATTVKNPTQHTVIDAFEAQVQQTPNNIALRFEGETLSYQQLNAQANQVAHYLHSLTDAQNQPLIQPDTLVGLCVERSLAMVIGLLGILKAGAAYVPLDPDYPTERLQYMLDDSQVNILLTQQATANTLKTQPIEHTLNLNDSACLAAQPTENPSRKHQPQHLAYLIYTSGTTGRPKGVMVPHQALANHMAWMQHQFDFQPTDRFLQKTPISFDAAVWEYYAPLLTGACLVIAAPGQHGDIDYLQQTLIEQNISVLQLVPTVLGALLEADRLQNTQLRYLFSGGEALTPTIQQQLHQQQPNIALYNLYGPTETTIDATYWHSQATATQIAIGRPIANLRAYLLDARHQIVPFGVPGELSLAGAGLARGYHNQPALTAEKFITAELFGNTERLYKTGDLAQWLPDGNLEYLGRIDNQIKLRGFRIELGEIETILRQHQTVHEAIVVLYERNTNKTLAAYVTPQKGLAEAVGTEKSPDESTIVVSDLKKWLKTRLPDYMVPNTFTVLDILPLTPNGKIDRKALPAPDNTLNVSNNIQPRDELECQLLTIWQTLLEIGNLSIHDDFFAVGGHSLLAMRLVSLIQHQLTVTLPVAVLFQHTTVATLAELIRQQQADTGTATTWSNCVPMQTQGEQTPLYVLPGALGSVLYLQPLAAALGQQQPTFALQTPGLQPNETTPTTLEALASYHVEAVRTQQPTGPYRLAGHSSGGRVAFEMAHQLEQAGEQIEFLGILDTSAPNPTRIAKRHPKDDGSERFQLGIMLRGFSILTGIDLPLTLEDLYDLPDTKQAYEQTLACLQQHQIVFTAEDTIEKLHRWVQTFRVTREGHVNYQTQAQLTCPIQLFRTSVSMLPANTAKIYTDNRPVLGWKTYTQAKVFEIPVPGTHMSMVTRPHVQILAMAIRECLQNLGQ